MVIKKIFPNPLVTDVIFQIRFPNLFYIENYLGEFQKSIISNFPSSSVIYKQPILFTNSPSIINEIDDNENPFKKLENTSKIWQFISKDKKVKVNVTNDSLDFSSQHHKTYNLGDNDKFRDVIEFILDNFFKIYAIPIIERIGLRYIDKCPLPSDLNNKSFLEFYPNTIIPLNRYNIVDLNEVIARINVTNDKYLLSYAELLRKTDSGFILNFDFDGYTRDIETNSYLSVTDEIHKMLSNEFEKSIGEPVIEIMNKETTNG